MCLLVLCIFAASAEATFPGRNGRMALSAETSVRFAQNAVLWDYDPATKKLRQLTRRSGVCRETGSNDWADGGQDYSPNGRWIAYLHGDGCRGGKARTGLWMMRADGRAKRQQSTFQMFDDDPVEGADAAFSPDGRAVAVLSWAFDDPRGYYALRVFRLPDGAVRQELFFDGSGIAEGLDWGTNRKLVISIEGDLHVLSPDGGGDRRMAFKRRGLWADEEPDWHPSSGAFAFHGTRYDDDYILGESIFRGFPNRQQAVRLTRAGGSSPRRSRRTADESLSRLPAANASSSFRPAAHSRPLCASKVGWNASIRSAGSR